MEPELDANSEIDSTLVASSGTSNSNSAYTKSSDNSPTILDNGMELTSKIHILEKMNKKVRTELEEIYSYRMISPQSHDLDPTELAIKEFNPSKNPHDNGATPPLSTQSPLT